MIISDKIFYEMWNDAAKTEKEKFVVKWCAKLGADLGLEETIRIAKRCESVWHVAHLSVRDIRATTHLSQAGFSARFCIPKRTLERWEYKGSGCPSYCRLMLARLCGLADDIFREW